MLLAMLCFAASAQKKDKGDQHVEFRYHGFYSVVDYALMKTVSTLDDIESPLFHSINVVAGFQWRPESAVGFGFSYLHDASGAFSQIPMYVEYRTHYLRGRVAPFTTARVGFSVPVGSGSSGEHYAKINLGGLTFGARLGVRYAFTRSSGANIFAGYQMLQLNQVERGTNGQCETIGAELFHTIQAGLGFNF